MKNKKILVFTIVSIVLVSIVIGLLHFWVFPAKYAKECKLRVYNDLESKVEIVKKSVVGIIPETTKSGLKSHNGLGSGVIFDKKNNTYYAVTAAHVVENPDTDYKVFTKSTEFSGEIVKVDENVNFEIPDDEYYASLLNGKIEYISPSADLAILSFESEEELPVLEFETKPLKIEDRIIAIGHPEGNKYVVTYGTIISTPKTVTISGKGSSKKNTDTIIEHNAYLNFGNSGGVAISENMKIAGINIGGAFNLLGYFSKGFMIPYDIVEENINKWKETDLNKSTIKTNSWNKDKVTITVSKISKDRKTATIIIEDKNDNPKSWGMEFSIQKQSEGDSQWYDLNSNTKIEWLRTLAVPNDRGITEMKIDWSDMYVTLAKGTYRVVKQNGFMVIYSEPFSIE